MSFGRRLKFLRRREGLPIGKVAEKVGLPRELLRDMEAGRREPTPEVIHSLAAHFRVNPSYFEGRDRRPSPPSDVPVQHPRAGASGRWSKTLDRPRERVTISIDDFAYFREPHPARPANGEGAAQGRPDSALPLGAPPGGRFRRAAAPDLPAPNSPARTAPATRPPGTEGANDRLAAALERASTHAIVCALARALVARGVCSEQDLLDALARFAAAGGAAGRR